MILINLHPLEPQRRRIRARRANMSPEQRTTARRAEADRQKQRRVDNPDAVRAYERADYLAGPRRARNLLSSWRHRLRTYGLTPETYQALVDKQGNRCACCDATEPGRGDVRWCIDHNHVTKVVRGLVCHRCNTAIGLLGDTLEGVMRAVLYLQRAENPQ